jgi:glucose dehydrogenase
MVRAFGAALSGAMAIALATVAEPGAQAPIAPSNPAAATTAAPDRAAPITAARLQAPEPGDWTSYRRTYDVTGFSPLTAIDRTTVKRLRPVWSYSMRRPRRRLRRRVGRRGVDPRAAVP